MEASSIPAAAGTPAVAVAVEAARADAPPAAAVEPVVPAVRAPAAAPGLAAPQAVFPAVASVADARVRAASEAARAADLQVAAAVPAGAVAAAIRAAALFARAAPAAPRRGFSPRPLRVAPLLQAPHPRANRALRAPAREARPGPLCPAGPAAAQVVVRAVTTGRAVPPPAGASPAPAARVAVPAASRGPGPRVEGRPVSLPPRAAGRPSSPLSCGHASRASPRSFLLLPFFHSRVGPAPDLSRKSAQPAPVLIALQ